MPPNTIGIDGDFDFTGISFGFCNDPSRRDDIATVVAFILNLGADEAGPIADRIVKEERFRIETDYHTAVQLQTELYKVGVTANSCQKVEGSTSVHPTPIDDRPMTAVDWFFAVLLSLIMLPLLLVFEIGIRFPQLLWFMSVAILALAGYALYQTIVTW